MQISPSRIPRSFRRVAVRGVDDRRVPELTREPFDEALFGGSNVVRDERPAFHVPDLPSPVLQAAPLETAPVFGFVAAFFVHSPVFFARLRSIGRLFQRAHNSGHVAFRFSPLAAFRLPAQAILNSRISYLPESVLLPCSNLACLASLYALSVAAPSIYSV